VPLSACCCWPGKYKNIGEKDIPARYTRGIFLNVILVHRRHDFAVSHQRFIVWAEVHITNKPAIPQALIASINIWTTLATYNVFFYLHFRNPVYEIFYLDTNIMQHFGQAILVHGMAQAFFVILIFYFGIEDRQALQ
jgi:hypothetical protein